MKKNSIPYKNSQTVKKTCELGFSLVELIIVLLILAIMSAISIPYFLNYKKLYKSDNQAKIIMDLISETGQRALTQCRTFRFEIDMTTNTALIIDENNIGATDDREVKVVGLEVKSDVRVDRIPNGITKPNPPNYNDAVFARDNIGHISGNRTVSGNQVWAVRFQRDGTVVNSSGNLTSANLYVWTPLLPNSDDPSKKQLVRCITLAGTSSGIRYWKHDGTTFVAY